MKQIEQQFSVLQAIGRIKVAHESCVSLLSTGPTYLKILSDAINQDDKEKARQVIKMLQDNFDATADATLAKG